MSLVTALLIDLSGTVHVGDVPTPGAAAAIRALRAFGIELRWLSNTSKESRRSLLAKLKKMDLDVREEELFTSLSAVAGIVVARNLNPLYILTPSAIEEFPPTRTDTRLDSIVVGLAPDRLSYDVLNEAFRLLTNGNGKCPLIATHKATYYRAPDGGLSLGPGPFISALEEATGVSAEVVGKPSEAFFQLALDSLSSTTLNSQVAIIGDDKTQDVGLVPHQLGLSRFLVRTGKYREGDDELIRSGAGGETVRVFDTFAKVVEDLLEGR